MSTSPAINAAGVGCRRKSIFTEIALDDDVENEIPTDWTDFNMSWGFLPIHDGSTETDDDEDEDESDICIRSPSMCTDYRQLPSPTIAYPKATRLIFLALVLALISPILHGPSLGVAEFGAKAWTVRGTRSSGVDEDIGLLAARADSPATVCTRWAHQSTTLIIYLPRLGWLTLARRSRQWHVVYLRRSSYREVRSNTEHMELVTTSIFLDLH